MRCSTSFIRLLSPSRGAIVLFAMLGLSGCESPPPDAYTSGGPRGQGALVGYNSVGDPCYQYKMAQDAGADIYCGAWGQPAGRIRISTDAGTPEQQAGTFASSLAPRITECGAPQPIRFSEADQAVRMTCSRGRWPHAAMVASAGGKVYVADGMEAVIPAMQRSIGVLAGRAQPLPADDGARRSAGRRPDPTDFQGLMKAGDAANREGSWEEAASYFRTAVQLQEKSARKDNWALFNALMGLGVQLSNQGKFTEADAVFARANDPALLQSGPFSPAHYDHYKGLHVANRGMTARNAANLAEALVLLRSAEQHYYANLPAGAAAPSASTNLLTLFAPTTMVAQLAVGGSYQAAAPAALEAVLGVIETRRNQANVLRAQGDHDNALVMATSAEDFARSRGMTLPKVAAFFYRTTGVVMLQGGQVDPSVSKLGQSVDAFRAGWRATPTRQLAQTQLRRAEALLRAGDAQGTFESCRDATQTLVTLRESVDGDLLEACLIAYARRIATASDPQPLLRDMFLTAQLSRASATAELAQKAALRLQADPRIARELAIRDSANAELNELREQRAKLPPNAPATAAIDRQIETAEATLRQTEIDLQDALPNYHALLEPFATAEDVFKVLRPGEVLAAISLADSTGWVFVLRDNRIRLGRIEGGNRRMTALVTKLRASIEPSGGTLPDYDTATARDLYAAVFGEVAAELEGAKELSVAPAGKLLSIPFQILVTDTFTSTNLSDAPFLVKKFPITHVPSVANLLRLRQQLVTPARSGAPVASAPKRPWFGFGASNPISPAVGARLYPAGRCGEQFSAQRIAQLAALPGADLELSVVRQLLGASRADELTGAAFTRNAAISRPLTDYRVLHFASHALLESDIDCLDEPAIVTSVSANDPTPALLSATDILVGMKLNADVVVLSACNTGGGSGRDGGESLSGLAKSFFFAGARALMVTHWAVDDRTSVRLVAEALNGMKDSPTGALSPALRDVQMRLLATAGYEHPYFWAPMIVLGEGGGRPAAGEGSSSFRSAGL
jgi:CHAT domain-containing protein